MFFLLCLLLSVPSSPPSNVVVVAVGDNKVQVSWTPPADISRYVVIYTCSAGAILTAIINDAMAASTELTQIPVGEECTIWVRADGDIIGPTSDPINIILAGMHTHIHMCCLLGQNRP